MHPSPGPNARKSFSAWVLGLAVVPCPGATKPCSTRTSPVTGSINLSNWSSTKETLPGDVVSWNRHRHHAGPHDLYDTTNAEWRLPSGHR